MTSNKISLEQLIAIIDVIGNMTMDQINELIREKLPTEYHNKPKTLLLLMSRLMARILYMIAYPEKSSLNDPNVLQVLTNNFCQNLQTMAQATVEMSETNKH